MHQNLRNWYHWRYNWRENCRLLTVENLKTNMNFLNMKTTGMKSSQNIQKVDWSIVTKKQKDTLETWAVYREISLVSWELLNGPKQRGSILRNMVNSEGDQLLAGALHAIMEKIEADTLQIAKKWNWIWIFIHQRHFFISAIKLQYCTKVHAPSRLVSKVCAKYKDLLTKILKPDARTNSS